ncbi:MAG: EF-P beta-lysylation protein EpmB [Gammaproteobacteria bacterium CG_4_10_14_0_8_um_filter_38_16]|nr:MAG: EF-P beta-lysylation protein EpmB [Gammaproteobacteria bacterium CG_4_10_14_0_8_um_filter_38_16]PJA03880.1 MAG: EF-P beta-lysylation protein EpmB [Gammaproteobacteria bacterium CG_4_10_14_0_2_um_filter_38_22]PJB09506.1 MAG: EF-P beta-lysylation protein EpmB [Gammaproteobacteria bacterium CG_4_9_14_3_um_filter_38_9]
MIHPTWQNALSHAITRFSDLCEVLQLNVADADLIAQAQHSFPLRVPREFVSRMEMGNSRDPLLLQVLPQAIEMQKVDGFSVDPLSENKKNPIPGLLHKYPNRVLLTLSGACAVHCRYCFRRHFPYEDNTPGRANWDSFIHYIANQSQVDEVIFSGGDPLILKDHLLAELVLQLEKIPHLKRLRIHTRLPIVIPARVTDEWIAWMQQSRFQITVVVHCNHANEIDDAVLQVLKRLRSVVTVLNQSVLLKDINDDATALVNLSKRLFEAAVLPYYLHLLDKVDGAAHFDVPEEKANNLMQAMKQQLPGFLVPKLAREVSGMLSKLY